MSDLYDHAGNYPPRFDNDADRQRAQAEAAQLNRLFAGIIKVKAVTPQQPEKYINVLYRLARLNAMAHNMDMPNAAAQADRYFEEMIKLLNGKPKEKSPRPRRIRRVFGGQQPHRPRHAAVAAGG